MDAIARSKPRQRAAKRSPLEQDGESFLDGFLLYRLSVVSNLSSRTLSSYLDREVGLSIPEWRVILIIGKIPGLSTDQVADRTTMDKAKVSRAIGRLSALGYIDRQVSASDRRQNRLSITRKGMAVFERCLTVAEEVQEEVLKTLTTAEEKTLFAILMKIQSNNKSNGSGA